MEKKTDQEKVSNLVAVVVTKQTNVDIHLKEGINNVSA